MENFEEKAQELLEDNQYKELNNLIEEEIKNNPSNVHGYEYKVKSLFFEEQEKEDIKRGSSEPNLEEFLDGSFFDVNKYIQINELCDYILENFPEEFEICWIKMCAMRNINNGSEDTIINFCDELINKYPKNAKVYTIKADYIELPIEERVSLYETAIDLDPKNILYYVSLADIYEEANIYDLAEKSYVRALDVAENSDDIDELYLLMDDLSKRKSEYEEELKGTKETKTALDMKLSQLSYAVKIIICAAILTIIILYCTGRL